MAYTTPHYYQTTPTATPTLIKPANIPLGANADCADPSNTFEPINPSSLSSNDPNRDNSDVKVIDLDRMFDHRNTPPRRKPLPLKAVPPLYPVQQQVTFPSPALYTMADSYVPM